MTLSWPPAPLQGIWELSLVRICLLTPTLNKFHGPLSSTYIILQKLGLFFLRKMQRNWSMHLLPPDWTIVTPYYQAALRSL